VKKKIAIAASAMLLAGCAADQALIEPTVSGYPEGTFANTSLESVENKLIGACSRVGAMVSEATLNQVVCGKALEGGEAAFAQILVGNSYSTTPVQKLGFVMYASGSSVKVTAYQWIETQMALGQMRKIELKGNKQRNDLQQLLHNLGAEYATAPTRYSTESQVVLELLKRPPKHPANEGIGAVYYVNVPMCDVRREPKDGGPVVKQYTQGSKLEIYARTPAFARVSPDGVDAEWVAFALLASTSSN
jgi:hypothetical protein